MGSDRWLLPEGVEEILPPESWRLEAMRRRLLDLYRSWGYELVVPPLIEYLDSLLTGAGHDLDLQTFKLTDQLSGRLMGIRADMTPQAARIDANRLKQEGPTRVCYIGTVVRTRPDGLGGSRCPQQVGVELFGHAGIESDLEILGLMLETMNACGVANVSLDLGHVGIYRALAVQAGFTGEQEEELFGILQRKSQPDLQAFLSAHKPPGKAARMLTDLIELNGDVAILKRAHNVLSAAGKPVMSALDNVQRIAERIATSYPSVPLHIDLAELRGYRYKTGVVFAAFVEGQGRELARGGRYDATGAVFGRSRPATGFSADLAALIRLGKPASGGGLGAVLAPADDDAALAARISSLRGQGRRVIVSLPGQVSGAADLACTEQLVRRGAEWALLPTAIGNASKKSASNKTASSKKPRSN